MVPMWKLAVMDSQLAVMESEITELSGKKVCIVVENLPVPFDRRVWQEATTLKEAGMLVSVISPKTKSYNLSYELIEGIHVYRHPLPTEADGALGYLLEYSAAVFWQLYLSFKILFKHGFDVIHGCNPPDLVFILAWIYKPFGKKYIFDHHDINPELFEAKFNKKGAFYRLICLMEKLTFKSADVCIATNESYKKIAIERGGKNPDEVHVVRSGPNLDRLRIKGSVIRYKYGREFMVGYVGVMGKQEGVDGLLEAVSYILNVRERKDIHFCIVGSGTEIDFLQDLASSLGVSEYVSFEGRVSDDVLIDILNTADVCVNPDIVNDMNSKSTMNKIMEYMALSKPIVQFDMKEGRYSALESSLYAKSNDYKDFADKILHLLDNSSMRKTMGEFGRSRVFQKLSWEHEAPNLIDAYKHVLRK